MDTVHLFGHLVVLLVSTGLERIVSYIHRICKKENVSVEELKSGSRCQIVSTIRSQLARKLVKDWGISLTEAGRHLRVLLLPSAIAKTLYRLVGPKSSL